MKTLALASKAKGENCSRWSQFWEMTIVKQIDLKEDNGNKRKGGRPRKSAVSRKNKTIGVCFSEPELYTIKFRAKQADLPLSIYCHDAILEGVIKEPLKKEELEVLRSLSNIGNNLNQLTRIAKFLNTKRLEKEAEIVLNQIQTIINKLSDDWKNSKRKKL